MKKILRTKYEKYQSEIRSLCLQLGLVEHNKGSITEFRTEYDTSFIYGEVIRLFDYDSMYYASVVFFNELVQVADDDYQYIYNAKFDTLPFKTDSNNITFYEPLDKVLEKVRSVVTYAIKQRKELAEKEKLNKLKEDFK